MEPRLPPQDLEAEQSVLGGILIDNQIFFKVVDLVSAEDFYRPANGKLFTAMVELASKGEPIDLVTVSAKLKEMQIYHEVGGASYLAELLEKVATAVNSEYHANLVANQAVKRRLISLCNEIGAKGLDPSETVEELVEYAEKKIFSLASLRKQKALSPIRDLVQTAFLDLEKRFEKQEEITGVPTGFLDLDRLTAGFQPSDLIIVACRPSMGKTSFALGVSRYAATHSHSTLFFSLEMAKEQLVNRLLAAEAKVDSHRIRTGKLTEQDWSRLTRAAGILSEAKIFIDDTPSLSAIEMRGKARRLKAEIGNLGLIVVDYLQIMGTPRGIESREQAIADMSKSLKAMAKELNVPVVALSQLNRNIEQRQDKRPMLSDIRESGAIEQDADVIIFIHREVVETLQPNTPSVAEFIIGKQRNGPCGTVKVVWLSSVATFENLAHMSTYGNQNPTVEKHG